MLTRCPKCHTLFRISENHLRRARGKTRCGQCYTVFEAKEATLEEAPRVTAAATQDFQRAPSVQSADDFESTARGMSTTASSIYNELIIKSRSLKYDIPDVDDDRNNASPASSYTSSPRDNPPELREEISKRILELRRRADPGGLSSASRRQPVARSPLRPAPMPMTKDPSQDMSAVPAILLDDLYDDAHTLPTGKNLLIILGILCSLFALLVQYVYVTRNQLAQNIFVRPHLVSYCKLFGCDVPYKKDVSKIQSLSFTADRHPKNSQLTIARLNFVNRASYIQPFPTVVIKIRDQSQAVVAMRRIFPAEYLPQYIDVRLGLEPKTPVDVTLLFENKSLPATLSVVIEFE